jgi:hypothetical protein
MNRAVEATPPCNQEEVLQVCLWWTTHFLGRHFGYSEARASQLHQRGMLTIEAVWDLERGVFKTWPKVQRSFGLTLDEQENYTLVQCYFPARWRHLLITPCALASVHDWIGFFSPGNLELPSLVICASEDFS